MTVLSIDFETRSPVDLRETGVYPYAAHPHTDIWCMAWAFDDEEPEVWTPDVLIENDQQPHALPDRVLAHIGIGGEIRAWNAAFERIIWREIMVKRYGAPTIKDDQFVCSAAEAAAMALPRSLDECATVLKVQAQKDKEGYALMLRMSRPRRWEHGGMKGPADENDTPIWWDDAGKFERLCEYCKQDVRTERSIVKALRRLVPMERQVYLLDQKINDRGVPIDRRLVLASKAIVEEGVERANLVLEEITKGAVTEVTNNNKLRTWLNDQGVETNSVAKAAVREMLESDLSPEVRLALQTRADAGRSSVAKLDAMLAVAGSDDRLRGLLLYHAASTGRWGGRLVQPQNFPRGEVDQVESYIPDVMAGHYDRIDLLAHPIVVVSSLLRSCLVAGPGKELIAADFSAIEARVLNWLAGQDDIVAMFARGEDVYKYNAARLYNIPLVDVKKFPHRQTGKFQELGCGFQMGWSKAISAAKTIYQLDLDESRAKEIVSNYRETHPKVVAFWKECESALLAACERPGQAQVFGARRNLKAIVAGSYLYIVLPSGRPLCYAAPRVVEAETPWGSVRPQVEYSGVDPLSKKWGRLRLYGGLIAENIVQAAARDLMAEGALRLEDAGYLILLSCHDELVAEVATGFGSVEEFERLLAEVPEWASGCPVAAEGWKGQRYRK